jgi:hypothetical protein
VRFAIGVGMVVNAKLIEQGAVEPVGMDGVEAVGAAFERDEWALLTVVLVADLDRRAVLLLTGA